MARLKYSIGVNIFLGITGERAPLREILTLDERPGIDGTEITQEGKKGRPFTIRSWVDQVSYDAARFTYEDYLLEIDSDPQELVVADISSFREGFKVQVLDVRVVFCGQITPGTNGLNAPSLGFLECEWDLIAVPL